MPPSRKRVLSTLPALALFTCQAVHAGAQAAPNSAAPDLSRQPTLYAVGYAHLDTEWRWEYPQVIDEYLRRTMQDNFRLIDKYPHYIFNFSGSNRYRLMQEYFPKDFDRLKQYVAQGRWFPAGSSVEEGDVNAPNAEAIFRQILYGNQWFRKNLGKSSEEYMLPDCFGFPSSLPSILSHSGVKGFSTQKLVWGSSANVGGPESLEKTPEGTPFNVGVWVGPDGSSVLAGVNPGAYNGSITTDLSQPLPPLPPSPALADVDRRLAALDTRMHAAGPQQAAGPEDLQQYFALRNERAALEHEQTAEELRRFQGDWAARVLNNGKINGVFTDYHYYGTGDIGGAPREESVKRLEAIITQGSVEMPPANAIYAGREHPAYPVVPVGHGPVRVISATADQMFRDITPEQEGQLPRYTGELELTNHSAASLTSQAYQKRWIRKEELLADAAEKSSLAAMWLGGRTYPLPRLNDAWTLAMAAHFHDLAAGTATPRAYEFAWNDDAIAMNQFADVLKSAAGAVSEALDTTGDGTPLVVFNQLNVPRQDLVEAALPAADGRPPKAVRVTDPQGREIPSQISRGKVLFAASVPSVGYAVFHVAPAGTSTAAPSGGLHVTENQLENAFYRVTLNAAGDVSSIFDKQLGRELLRAPARLALSYDNPQQWPAWNMDWDQEQAAPREFVGGPAKIRIVENGPVRVALEVTRDTAGSHFIQTIRLAAGDAGKRVEFSNIVDWNTRERNLKASFPLVASNEMATYNWDVGTIQRPTAQPKKFEVPSHQWIDLTDMSGRFGTTLLTDAKNGSDKPDDHTLRLTLLVTPGTAGGYPDQATQDIGHHEILYGLSGHSEGWRSSGTDWQAQRLNAPLLAFAAPVHAGALGKEFSLLKVSNPRIRVLGMKKAEDSDELVVRLVELDGKPQPDVHLHFASPVTAAREINGQEQPVGPAQVEGGDLISSFNAYEPRTFALKLGASPASVAAVQSVPLELPFDLATTTSDGDPARAGIDGKGDTLPAEMLPAELKFNDITFHLGPAKSGVANALVARGQRLRLPAGKYDRVYLLAAAAGGDQKAEFRVGTEHSELTVQDWGGFVGQWDDREWSGDPVHGSYGEMTGLRPGFLKRADIAWYASHHHDASGKNVDYSYSYLFAYPIDLPPGATSLQLPKNDRIRIFAVSVANEGGEAKPVQPLYDELPARGEGDSGFGLTVPPSASVTQGRSAEVRVLTLPRGGFDGHIHLEAQNLPSGITASFSPVSNGGSSLLTLHASAGAPAAMQQVTITASAGGNTETTQLALGVQALLKGTVPVDLAPVANVHAIYSKGAQFPAEASLDGESAAFPEAPLGREQVGDEVTFRLGAAGQPDAVSSRTIPLPAGSYGSLRLLATAVEGAQTHQRFSVTYSDGTTASFERSLSDWAGAHGFKEESEAVEVPYRVMGDGSADGNPFHLFAYRLPLDPAKQVQSLTLPGNRNVIVFAATLVPKGSEEPSSSNAAHD